MNRQLRNAFLSLVQSLSPAEKRLISLNISKSGNKSTGVLDLIKLAQQLDTWDEELVRARIPASRLDHRIVYASEKIFQLLTEYQKRGHQSVIRNVLFLETAVEMNLEYFVIRFLKEVVKECEEKELWEIQIHAINTAIRFLQRSDSISRNQEFIESMERKRKRAFTDLQDYHQICELVANYKVPNQRGYLITGKSENAPLTELVKSEEFITIQSRSRSNKLKLEILSVHYYLEKVKGNQEKSLDFLIELIELFTRNPWLKNDYPIIFLDKCIVAINQAGLSQKKAFAVEMLELLEKNKNLSLKSGYYIAFGKLLLFKNFNIDLNVSAIQAYIKRKVAFWDPFLSQIEKLNLFYLNMLVCWEKDEHSEVDYWADEVISMRDEIIRFDLVGIAYVYQSCALFETGQIDRLNKTTGAGLRYLKKNVPEFSNSIKILEILNSLTKVPLLEIKSTLEVHASKTTFEDTREKEYFSPELWLLRFLKG